MIRKLFPRHNELPILIPLLLVVLSSYVFPSGQNAAYFGLETENNHSVVRFRLPEGWKVKVLNSSPAVKILIKLINHVSDETPEAKIDNALPSYGGVRSYRILPLTSSSVLLVLELAGKMAFRWEGDNSGRLVIYDEDFRDPSQREFLRGLQLHRQGKLREALSAYRRAVHLNRRNGNAYYKAGQIRFAFKQYRLAEINYNHALRLKCDSLGLYPALAQLYRLKGRTKLMKKYQRLYREKQQEQVLSQQTENRDVSSRSETEQSLLQEKKEQKEAVLPAESQARSTPTAPAETEQSLPVRIALYLTGIALLSIFLIVSGFLYFQKKRYRFRRATENALFSLDSGELNVQKEKILQLARQAAHHFPSEVPPEMEAAREEKGDSSSEEAVTVSVEEKPDFSSVTEEGAVPNRTDVARLLNLGVGEIELALNLTAHQRQAQKKRTLMNEIEEMHQQDISVTEIARRMGMGQGEVELLLAMKKGRMEPRSL